MKFVLPIFLDSEYAEGSGKGRSDQLSKADRTRFLRIICERLQANGIPAGVYASTSWIKSRLDASQLPFSWWVAQWASKLSYSGDWLIWQYTSKGSVPGISGNVDCSQRNTSKPVTVPETAVKGVTAEDVLAVMRSWIGLSRSAGTHHVIIDTYNSYTPRARGYKVSYQDAFCDTTVSAAFIKLGAVDLIGGPECGVEEHVKLFKKAGIWEEDGTVTPEPGWLIVYNWDDNTQPNDGFSRHDHRDRGQHQRRRGRQDHPQDRPREHPGLRQAEVRHELRKRQEERRGAGQGGPGRRLGQRRRPQGPPDCCRL